MSQQNHQRFAYLGDESRQGHFLTLSQREHLSESLQTELRPEYRLRVEIMLRADDGQSQTNICKALSCSQHTARHWIAMLRAGAFYKWKEQPIGRPKTIDEHYLKRLRELASRSPRDYGYPFQCWTSQWLSKHLAQELGVSVSDRCLRMLLKEIEPSAQIKNQLADLS